MFRLSKFVILALVVTILVLPISSAPVSAADVGPVTVSTTSDLLSTYTSYQRKTFMAAGRYWVVYSDKTNAVYRTSVDGLTWTSPTILTTGIVAGSQISTWWDGSYIYYAASTGKFRRGLANSDGSISWSAVEQTYAVAAGGRPTVCVNTSGYPWVTYSVSDRAYVTKSSTKDGTWVTDAGFPYELKASDDVWRLCVVPLLSDNVYVAYAAWATGAQTKLLGKLYNGTWGAEENVTSHLLRTEGAWSMVSTLSDNSVNVVYEDWTTLDINWCKRTAGVWTEGIVQDLSVDLVFPTLSKTLNDDLYCFWDHDPASDSIYYKARISGVWGSRVSWLTEADYSYSLLTSAYQTLNGNIPVAWLADLATPYNIRFASLDIKTPISSHLTSVMSEGFEWGSVGDNLTSSGRWVPYYWRPTAKDATISDTHARSGSQSAKFAGDPVYTESYLPFNPDTIDSISAWIYKEDSQRSLYIRGGNSTQIFDINIDVHGALTVCAGVNYYTGDIVPLNTWFQIGLENIDFNSGTYDLYYNGTLVAYKCPMFSTSHWSGEWGFSNGESVSGADRNFWVDDIIVRNYRHQVWTLGIVLPYAFFSIALVAIIGAGLSGITSLGDIVVLAVSSVVAVIGVGLILDAVNAW